VSEILDTASYLIKLQAGKVVTSALSPTISRDTTDDDYFPTKGSRSSVYLTYSGGPLGGDTSFTKYGASTAWFFSLPLDMVFDVKGTIGYLQPNEGKPLPIYERYYIGGINTVRGLRYVGPHDPLTGDLIGGTTMLYFNVDLVFPLIKNAGMRGVVFFRYRQRLGKRLPLGRHAENGRSGGPLVLACGAPPPGMGLCPGPQRRRRAEPLRVYHGDDDVRMSAAAGRQGANMRRRSAVTKRVTMKKGVCV
jgi:hypothetical protein